MEIDDGGTAFPFNDEFNNHSCGMTLRDYFAAKAMQGLISQSNGTAITSEHAIGAKYAYEMADAMLKAREK